MTVNIVSLNGFTPVVVVFSVTWGLNLWSLRLDEFHSLTFKKEEGADRQLQSVHCHKDGSAIFAVLRAVLPNSRVFWDVTPCRWLR